MYNIPNFSEHEIRTFLREPSRQAAASRRSALFVLGVALAAPLLYAALNLPSLLYLNDVNQISSVAAGTTVTQITPEPTQNAVVPAAATPTPTPQTSSIPANTLSIPDLSISAPISWDVALDEKSSAEQLKSGVIHLTGTAKPGQKGMVAISGHSSNFPWARGSFNTVFAPLTKANTGQWIEINYNNTSYLYRITRMYEVKPTQVDILEDNSKTGLRLITCTPLGTSLRRLIIEAEQFSPDPAKNTAFTGARFSGELPADQ